MSLGKQFNFTPSLLLLGHEERRMPGARKHLVNSGCIDGDAGAVHGNFLDEHLGILDWE